jgi:hypothetical protein
MVKITWLGEDSEEMPGPSYNTWNGIKFPKGQAVEVSDTYMIAKARKNQFFRVTEEETIMEAKEHEAETKIEGQGKIEAQAEVKKKEHDFRQTEKGTGYSPAEKKPSKKKIKADPAEPATDA